MAAPFLVISILNDTNLYSHIYLSIGKPPYCDLIEHTLCGVEEGEYWFQVRVTP
jgi:hypothetical protein